MPYHVFVSYNHRDKEEVEPIVDALRRARLDVYFDARELTAGLELHPTLKQAIGDSRCFALFAGPNGLGPTQKLEAQSALALAEREACKFISVILPGANVDPISEGHGFVRLQLAHTRHCYGLVDELVRGILGADPIRLLPQIGQPFDANLSFRNKEPRMVKLYPLPKTDDAVRLKLTWETFGFAVERLKGQFQSCTPRVIPDAYFGLNEIGTAVVSFLAGREPVRGYIQDETRPGGVKFVTPNSVFPKLKASPVILLVDREIKTGSALIAAIKALQKRYSQPKIYFATLFAKVKPGRKDLHIRDLRDLAMWETMHDHLGNSIEEVFLVCTMTAPGIETPLPAV
jgi:hypothetical protein